MGRIPSWADIEARARRFDLVFNSSNAGVTISNGSYDVPVPIIVQFQDSAEGRQSASAWLDDYEGYTSRDSLVASAKRPWWKIFS